MRKELKDFLLLQKKDIFVTALNDENWCKQLTYLADIFGHLNKLNLKLQKTELNLITFKDTLRGFMQSFRIGAEKLIWVTLPCLKRFLKWMEVELHGSGIDPAEQLKSEISQHLHALEKELNRYFPDMLDEEEINLARNSFALRLALLRTQPRIKKL